MTYQTLLARKSNFLFKRVDLRKWDFVFRGFLDLCFFGQAFNLETHSDTRKTTFLHIRATKVFCQSRTTKNGLTNFCDNVSLASALNEFNIVFELGRPRLRLGPKTLACPDTKENETARCFESSWYRLRPRSQTPRAPTPNQTQWFSTRPRSFSTSFDILFDSGRLALGWRKIRYETEESCINSSRWFGNLPIPFPT